jgi:hypothetical protein
VRSGSEDDLLLTVDLCFLFCFATSQAAAVLEAESGYAYESHLVAGFRESISEGRWDAVESVLEDVGVRGQESLWVRLLASLAFIGVVF